MKKESIRSLYQMKSLVDQENDFKRFMRVQEATRNYQLDRRILLSIATEAGALYKVNSITLIEMNTFEAYFEENYRVKAEGKSNK